MSKRITYTITASMDYDGQCIALDLAEILGEAYGQHYASRYEADALCSDLQYDAEELETPGPVTYSVVESDASIAVGDWVVGDEDEDEERGRVMRLMGSDALVAWEQGVKTFHRIDGLEVVS